MLTTLRTGYGGTTNAIGNTGATSTYPSGVGAGAAGAGLSSANPTTGMGASGISPTGRTPGMSSNQPVSDLPSLADARKLERSGKMEKTMGTVLCSTTLKEKGLAKEQEAWQIRGQAESIAQAEALEAQARAHRGAAVGLGAGSHHLNPSTAPAASGNATY